MTESAADMVMRLISEKGKTTAHGQPADKAVLFPGIPGKYGTDSGKAEERRPPSQSQEPPEAYKKSARYPNHSPMRIPENALDQYKYIPSGFPASRVLPNGVPAEKDAEGFRFIGYRSLAGQKQLSVSADAVSDFQPIMKMKILR